MRLSRVRRESIPRRNRSGERASHRSARTRFRRSESMRNRVREERSKLSLTRMRNFSRNFRSLPAAREFIRDASRARLHSISMIWPGCGPGTMSLRSASLSIVPVGLLRFSASRWTRRCCLSCCFCLRVCSRRRFSNWSSFGSVFRHGRRYRSRLLPAPGDAQIFTFA
jgi:hypothetical protein